MLVRVEASPKCCHISEDWVPDVQKRTYILDGGTARARATADAEK
jgi:hypothetical protein